MLIRYKSNLYPGCLALIIGAVRCPENIGKVVRVRKYVYPGELVEEYNTKLSETEGSGYLVTGERLVRPSIEEGVYVKKEGCFCFVPEKNLMPIDDSDGFVSLVNGVTLVYNEEIGYSFKGGV